MNLCLHCRRRLATCVCSELRPFRTQTRFIILMHPMEYKKEKVGTGRFSHLILENSQIIVGIGFDSDPEYLKVLNDENYQSVVLYPGENTVNLSEASATDLPGKPLQVFVIDGTWACAKKMMKLTTSLHDLPRVSFTTDRISEFKVKHQPIAGCLSTAESLHQVLLELNRMGREATLGQEENLMDVFRKTVEQQLAAAADLERTRYRAKPFIEPHLRKISKKWQKRNVFFT